MTSVSAVPAERAVPLAPLSAQLFEVSPTPLLALDPADFRVVAANALAGSLLGAEPGSLFRPLVVAPEGRDEAACLRRFQKTGRPFFASIHTSKGLRSFEVRTSSLVWEGRNLILLALTDHTEARLGEQRLRIAFREARSLLRAAELILVGCDADHRVVKWNAQAQRVFGLPFDRVYGRPLDALPMGWDRQSVADALDACLQQHASPLLGDLRYTRPDGKVGFLKFSFRPLEKNREVSASVLVVGEEITQFKILEQQLLQSQKLESIGQLASGIAHEINTPIQYVSGNLGFLQEAFKSMQDILDRYRRLGQELSAEGLAGAALEDIAQAREAARLSELEVEIPESIADSIVGVDRVAAIVGAMKKFSHPDAAGKRLVDVNKAIESTLTISRNEWKYNATLETSLDPDLPMIMCVPGDFNQTILNILVNAAHAVSERYQGTGERGAISVTTAQKGDFVRISISDTGNGIAEENRSRVFDPFFTTKEVGRGTGQGLAIVHSIMSRHDGSVDFESTPGLGTTFHLLFPIGQEGRP